MQFLAAGRAVRTFAALQPGEPFLFKLHSPKNFIVGGGFFAWSTTLPISLAWEAFEQRNGASSFDEMRSRVQRYRERREAVDPRADFPIGCRILERPFFFDEAQWVPAPISWHPNIQQGRTFSTDQEDGRALFDAVQQSLAEPTIMAAAPAAPRFDTPQLVLPRLGQGSFRVVWTDAYQRRCALTGEKVLPVLEAAHIRPYARGGEHAVTNGLLLRRDLHTLFDRGYLTVSPDRKVTVSRRRKEDFENGREYYALQGHDIRTPDRPEFWPDRAGLEWHNDQVFLG